MFLRRLATCLRVTKQERPTGRNTVKGKACLMHLTARHNVCRGPKLNSNVEPYFGVVLLEPAGGRGLLCRALTTF
jgi:hypothetical protein